MKYNIEELMKQEGSIGAWIKDLDMAFTNLTRETPYGSFDRIDWQSLTFLNNHPNTSVAEVKKLLQYFTDETELNHRIKDFENKKFILIGNEGQIEFTELGMKAFKKASAVQAEILEKSFTDITQADYVTTIRVVKQMLQNIQPYINNTPKT
ncbi:hypothetical protein H8S90_13390 [Olivibacter sp. SDN3]|uniref:hypothetical protein n=1 Tax=Olivibacter sp. SDN3 TaxID=2764720 RepID=UPI001651A0BE|nr:hypothetical protein [Olivibacter sp. SDN3]QNL47814.1 hypothetical protein H8S90_13390 [Olivibacter sp. SDN3]